MYQNNEYPNQENAQTDYGTYGSASYSNYDFGSKEANQGPAYGSSAHYGSVPPLKPEAAPKAGKEESKGRTKAAAYFKKALLCASLGLFFGLCAGVGFYAVNQAMGVGEKESPANVAQTMDTAENWDAAAENISTGEISHKSITMVDTDITSVVKEVMPAMVSIGNEYQERYSYFGQTFSQDAMAAGSGIIVGENDTELLVVTNYHVIEDADRLTVTFIDKTEAQAQLKGSNAGMDLAVLAVPLSELSEETLSQVTIAELGDSDSLNLGEPVIAIGNALGYGQSVTNGIVSALDREITLSNGQTGTFVQTNAAINPGNSGGALLNIEGKVIGINSNKISSNTIEGMGYAIPISAAKPIIVDLMLKETKIKVAEGDIGYIGIRPATVTEEISQMYGMPQGVYIREVFEDTAASVAGLAPGDIITEIDGTAIESYEDLQEEMQFHASGSTVDITVQRPSVNGYQEMTFSVTLGNRSN